MDSQIAVFADDTGLLINSPAGLIQLTDPSVGRLAANLLIAAAAATDTSELTDWIGKAPDPVLEAVAALLESAGIIDTNPHRREGRSLLQDRALRVLDHRPGLAVNRLAASRVLVRGNTPWAALTALELLTAGTGTVTLECTGVVTAQDAYATDLIAEERVGYPRAATLGSVIVPPRHLAELESNRDRQTRTFSRGDR